MKYRESSVGCGVLAGAALGLLVGMAVTIAWFEPGTWRQWAAAGACVLLCTAGCALGVRRWGERAWPVIYHLFKWFQ